VLLLIECLLLLLLLLFILLSTWSRNFWTHPHMSEWRYSTMHSALALFGGEWSASHPGHFTPGERAHSTHWKGGWVGPRTNLDTVAKRKNPSPCKKLNPNHPAYSLVILTQLPSLKLSIFIFIISTGWKFYIFYYQLF